jgi:hypothetical protein
VTPDCVLTLACICLQVCWKSTPAHFRAPPLEKKLSSEPCVMPCYVARYAHRSNPGIEHVLEAGGAGQHGAGAQDRQDTSDSGLLLDGAACATGGDC